MWFISSDDILFVFTHLDDEPRSNFFSRLIFFPRGNKAERLKTCQECSALFFSPRNEFSMNSVKSHDVGKLIGNISLNSSQREIMESWRNEESEIDGANSMHPLIPVHMNEKRKC